MITFKCPYCDVPVKRGIVFCPECQMYIGEGNAWQTGTAVTDEALKGFWKRVFQFNMDLGFRKEIEWARNRPPIEDLHEEKFFYEYVWVVLNSGMKNQVAREIFDNFERVGEPNFDAIRHPDKNRAVREVYKKRREYFEGIFSAGDKLEYFQTLPHIGGVTRYHLAKNLGMDVAKPDRHLVKVAKAFGYEDVQLFCQRIAELSGERVGTVDNVIWRWMNINKGFLNFKTKWRRFNRRNKEGLLG